MQANVETKKQYIEPNVVELGNVATITLGIPSGGSSGHVVYGGSSGSCTFTKVAAG